MMMFVQIKNNDNFSLTKKIHTARPNIKHHWSQSHRIAARYSRVVFSVIMSISHFLRDLLSALLHQRQLLASHCFDFLIRVGDVFARLRLECCREPLR
ncbi:hypothetical protein NPIL_223251 [Nephila pilipes]|uniref:Uncharacterized protein n=1 Tax=Nephila pilipes TaxID=299642 RepID=A0A8X6ISF2_NEPPI|nr:hypothetical protein NPIL_223251 [Nephila pilipes]